MKNPLCGSTLVAVLGAAAAAALMLVVPTAMGSTPPPAIAFTPSTYDYGTVDPGSSASATFSLKNTGSSATSMLKVSLSGSAFSITADACTGTSLGKGKSCSVTVQYSPSGPGSSDSGTLTASAKKPSASASAALTGSGAASTPDLTLSPGTLSDTTPSGTKDYDYDFGAEGTLGSATQTFTVTNNGPGASEKLQLTIGDDPLYSLGNDTCDGQTIAQDGTCTFDLSFNSPGCDPSEQHTTQVDVSGTSLDYIDLNATGLCFL